MANLLPLFKNKNNILSQKEGRKRLLEKLNPINQEANITKLMFGLELHSKQNKIIRVFFPKRRLKPPSPASNDAYNHF